MIEKPPHITNQQYTAALLDNNKRSNEGLQTLLDKINDGYEYWDTVKYKKLPSGITPIDLWTYVKASRANLTIGVWQNPLLELGLTNKMQRLCHEFDMNFGGSWGDNSVIPAESRQQYLVSSLMEEAYIKRKQSDKNSANRFFKLGNINERQAQILKMYYEDPALILTVKDLQGKFLVAPTTAKNDLVSLLKRGLIKEIAFNKVKKGYIKGELFDSQVIDIIDKM